MWKLDAIAWWLIDLFVTDNNPAPSKLDRLIEGGLKVIAAVAVTAAILLLVSLVYFSFEVASSLFRHITG